MHHVCVTVLILLLMPPSIPANLSHIMANVLLLALNFASDLLLLPGRNSA